MKKQFTFWVLSLFCLTFIHAQSKRDLVILRGGGKIDIPFQYENNFIIVDVIFNGVLPLKFIFDTGSEHTILTRREITDMLHVNYARKFPIRGADLKTELFAYLATGVQLQINNLFATNRTILVLEDDYFRFEEFAGVDIHGIIGADFFRRFIVKINYRRKMITLYDPSHFNPPHGREGYVEVPLELSRHKPYIRAVTHSQGDTAATVKLLVDSGAGLPLLLHTNTDSNLQLPPRVIRSNIGTGLGGGLEGFVGRVENLDFAGFHLENVTTHFHDINFEDVDTAFLNKRNGILGNQILNRFTVIIDYVQEKMYIAPNQQIKRRFQYDKSGISMVASGINLTTYNVFFVVPGSPAAEAGVKVGDVIKRVNGLPAGFMTLSDVARKFQGRTGKRIRLVIDRNGEKIRVRFELRELI
jgi:hypothetical protein